LSTDLLLFYTLLLQNTRFHVMCDIMFCFSPRDHSHVLPIRFYPSVLLCAMDMESVFARGVDHWASTTELFDRVLDRSYARAGAAIAV
jgi:hypothetical protein